MYYSAIDSLIWFTIFYNKGASYKWRLTLFICLFRRSYFQPTCVATCDCDQNKFDPICGADGKTYFSACHAGCSNVTFGKSPDENTKNVRASTAFLF